MADAGALPLTGRIERPAGLGNHAPGMVRTCDTTGLPACLVAQPFVKYLAVLASMVHGFTVPGQVEDAMRRKGWNDGLMRWLSAAPWKDPGFSGFFLSLVIFGFLGGITGVTLGTQQINIIAHNTLRIPGHFHATVVGGTTLAVMGLAYYVVPLLFQREYVFKPLARL